MGAPITIVVACTHHVFSAGVAALLRQESRFRVTGEATDCDTAARLAVETRADVIVVDLLLLGSDGRELFNGFEQITKKPRIILLSTPADETRVLDVLRQGAWGVVLKDAAPEELVRSIWAAAAGEAWVNRETVSRLLDEIHRTAAGASSSIVFNPHLTPRAVEIVCEVAEGASNADIATTLGLRQQTVKNHLSNIFDVLGVSSRLELALYAVHHNVVARRDVSVASPRPSPMSGPGRNSRTDTGLE